MRELSELQLKQYNISQLLKLRQRMIDYITPYSEREIKWEVLDVSSLQDFFDNNYYDSKIGEYVSWNDDGDSLPVGMHYLLYELSNKKLKYFIGSIPNNIGKRTIIGCIMYFDNCEIVFGKETVTSLEQIEINYFYQNQGLMKLMLNAFSKVINKEKNVISTGESHMGKMCHIMDHIRKSLESNGFDRDIRFEYEVDEEYIKKLSKSRKRK